MRITRREFLKAAAAAFFINLFPLGLSGWAAGLEDVPGPVSGRKRLIVLFQRGAVDGLSVVIPYLEPNYYDVRPTISVPEPGGQNKALDLDGRFGLHPALGSLMPLWRQKKVAFVHACGSPDPSRSHFDAQRYMETGTPGVAATSDGWMNRLLAVLPGPHDPTQAVSIGPVQPQILKGRISVANIGSGRGAIKSTAMDRPVVESAFNQLYDGRDPLSQAYQEGQAARKQLMTDLEQEKKAADNGAPSPVGFSIDAERLAKLMVQDPKVQLAFLDLGGWDTHVNQGAGTGQLANHLKPLGDGLAALMRGLGPIVQDTVVVVMSEFGRTVHENGNGGTDHGHGNAMWVLGGPVRGGKVYGDWTGLSEGNLYEGRDLDVTSDFRHVLAQVLLGHLGVAAGQLPDIFPGMPTFKLTDRLTGLIS